MLIVCQYDPGRWMCQGNYLPLHNQLESGGVDDVIFSLKALPLKGKNANAISLSHNCKYRDPRDLRH